MLPGRRRPLPDVPGAAASLVTTILRLLGSRDRVARADSPRGERHGRRLQTLWLLAGAPHDDREFVHRLLVEAARVLRVGVEFHGFVAYLEGEEIVAEVAHDPPDGLLVAPFAAPGSIDHALFRSVLREGRTVLRSDARADAG
ncbi:MAG TPA: hypothetical protein VE591_01920, partial [Candidatus Acidoferrum sp.]|nr:hypothetical protein [Candidatus Acidoferrum sp.]